jgi:hypothetical protein
VARRSPGHDLGELSSIESFEINLFIPALSLIAKKKVGTKQRTPIREK